MGITGVIYYNMSSRFHNQFLLTRMKEVELDESRTSTRLLLRRSLEAAATGCDGIWQKDISRWLRAMATGERWSWRAE